MSELLRACRREPTRYTPVWLMRQAGRYQPEYRAIRERVRFIDLCKDSDLAAEVTLLAVEQLGVDAAIIFADILLILEPLQVGLAFTDNGGPRIKNPIRSANDVDGIAEQVEAKTSLDYVMQTIRKVRSGLPKEVPLIGFAGAPFTLASYLIEGGGSREYLHTKRLMFGDVGLWNVLMRKLTDAAVDYLNAQVDAGAQLLQVFDSWVGCISPADYIEYVHPHMSRLFSSIHPGIPVIHFATGNPALYGVMKQAGGHVIGLDWRVDLTELWSELGDVAVMGNLDPASLLLPLDRLRERTSQLLTAVGNRPGHIFNLGHGVLPQSSVDSVRALVDFVHEESSR